MGDVVSDKNVDRIMCCTKQLVIKIVQPVNWTSPQQRFYQGNVGL